MAKTISNNSKDLTSVLRKPWVTEKAAFTSEKGVYVFEVAKDSNKQQVAKAVTAHYKVTPVKVRVVNIPVKNVFVRGAWGSRGGGKKAYVYLKKGDKIEIV